MLDGQRYFSEFPDEEPSQPRPLARLLLSDELLVTLAAIEREISAFISEASENKVAGTKVSGNQRRD
ncbi:MAG: hypothetical protein IT536_12330 [Hyphomicrobiales bacterium]|nr:hypothetical protein [Hyphomicrobiales bacterium]